MIVPALHQASARAATPHSLRTSAGNLAMLSAILLASSFVSKAAHSLARELFIGDSVALPELVHSAFISSAPLFRGG